VWTVLLMTKAMGCCCPNLFSKPSFSHQQIKGHKGKVAKMSRMTVKWRPLL
jgi:hypothetical protein